MFGPIRIRSHMLPKPYRLTKKKDFDRVYRQGRSFFVREMGIKFARNGLEVSRFGFVVSLKVSKNAVDRNLAKRRMREAVRGFLPGMKGGFDCAVLTRPEVKNLKYGEIEDRLRFILKKTGLLTK